MWRTAQHTYHLVQAGTAVRNSNVWAAKPDCRQQPPVMWSCCDKQARWEAVSAVCTSGGGHPPSSQSSAPRAAEAACAAVGSCAWAANVEVSAADDSRAAVNRESCASAATSPSAWLCRAATVSCECDSSAWGHPAALQDTLRAPVNANQSLYSFLIVTRLRHHAMSSPGWVRFLSFV